MKVLAPLEDWTVFSVRRREYGPAGRQATDHLTVARKDSR
jgi:hypothetical protein